MLLFLNERALELTGPDTQDALEAARKDQTRVACHCTRLAQGIYNAKRGALNGQ
jgi:hypothetical protein